MKLAAGLVVYIDGLLLLHDRVSLQFRLFPPPLLTSRKNPEEGQEKSKLCHCVYKDHITKGRGNFFFEGSSFDGNETRITTKQMLKFN